uniref:Uncharacterized protein n=1 Tax=Picea sitchensis TaxID=3332 RepID=A0A6B9XRH1_PICSI|nr:hypothetical protein Q903MT_gene5786 [Picea sitchensis]
MVRSLSLDEVTLKSLPSCTYTHGTNRVVPSSVLPSCTYTHGTNRVVPSYSLFT